MAVDIEPVRAFDAVHGERKRGFVDRVMVCATHPRSLPRPARHVNRTMVRCLLSPATVEESAWAATRLQSSPDGATALE